jgi:aminodeoxyfutalosine deaminase
MTRPPNSRRSAATWLRALPKAELHLHLEGTVTPETLVELSQRQDDERLTLAQARALYRYTDFTGFLMAFKAVSERLRTAADYELITFRMLERLAAQGVVHAEVLVSVGVVYYWRRIEFEAGTRRAPIRDYALLDLRRGPSLWPGGGGPRLSQGSGVAP